MKRFYILFFLLLLGCTPVTGATQQSDPNIQLAIAGAQLTGTAQAFEMQIVGWTVTAQSWTPTPSLTPVPTSTPSITPTPTVNVTQTMVMANANAELTQISLQTEGEVVTNNAKAWLPYFIAFLSVCLAGFLAFVGAKRLSMMPTPVHAETGRAMPMINVLDGVAWDSDRMANGMSIVKPEYVKVLPPITGERQDLVNSLVLAKLPKRLPEPTSTPVVQSQLTAGNDAGLFPLPDWSLFESFQFSPNKPLPFAGKEGGLAEIDINQNPHIAVIGPTGSGKSRYSLRTLICAAAAAGNQVIVMGDMVDYAVFGIHPAVTLVPVENMVDEADAEKYVGVLRVILDEMTRRYKLLTEKGISTWDRAGGQNTVLFLDELGVAIEFLEMKKKQDLANWAKGILSVLAKKGRKAGMNIVFSSQRAVGLQNLLSQVDTFLFSVKNPNEERYAFGMGGYGATDLAQGYFLSRVGSKVWLNGAFQPSDEQVGTFLMNHRVESLEKPKWIEGVASMPLATPQAPLIAPKTEFQKTVEMLAESVRSEWRPELSKRKVAKLINKEYEGGAVKIVDAMIAYLMSNKNLEGVI